MKFKKMNNRGEATLNTFGGIAIMLVTFAIIMTVAFTIVEKGRTQMQAVISPSNLTNESITWSNNTFTTLRGDNAFLLEVSCTNVTTDATGTPPFTVLNSGNFTCTTQGINVTNKSDNAMADSINLSRTLLVTYTYKNPDAGYNGTSTLKQSMSEVPTFASVIVIALIGVALLGLTQYFRMKS